MRLEERPLTVACAVPLELDRVNDQVRLCAHGQWRPGIRSPSGHRPVTRRQARHPRSHPIVNGQVAVPAGGQLKVPTPRVDHLSFRAVPPRARAWRMRYESPAVTTTFA